MENFDELFETGLKFHGHRCPAMPMGLKAGLAARKALGMEHAKDKELFVESETGKGHAAGCFLDGIKMEGTLVPKRFTLPKIRERNHGAISPSIVTRSSLPLLKPYRLQRLNHAF